MPFATGLTIGSSAYNEEQALESVVRHWIKVLPEIVDDYEILLVNDGSTDRTGELMEELREEYLCIRVIHHPYNLGFRGFAQTLSRNARKPLFAGISCDGEYRIEDLVPMIEKIEEGCDIVIGVREQLSNYNAYRRFVSASYNSLVKYLFDIEVKDAGSLKLYRTEILQNMVTTSTSAFLNAERLIRAKRDNYRIGFTPIVPQPRRGGRARGARLSWVVPSAIDMFKLAWTLRQGRDHGD